MTQRPRRRNRTLLFRLYVLLTVGLVAVAAVLDFGFRELQARLNPLPDPWRDASFSFMEERLATAPPDERSEVAAALSETLGMPVQLLQADDVAGGGAAESGIQELVDAEGRRTWLIHDTEHGFVTRVGPIAPVRESPWLAAIPPLFYLAIFVLVGFWLRPLLRDLDAITASTRAFADDYREPQRTAPNATSLKELAENFDAMSARLSSLIQGQKELTSALSHEMRTPLARIRFALAVIGDKLSDADAEELEAIGQDVQEIERLIATMLNYARLDHPDTRMDWQDVAAEPWLRQTVERSSLPNVDVRIHLDDADANVAMDPRLMTIALSNLLMNACRHAARAIEVSFVCEHDTCRLKVDDDGPGIPEADRARVFKAFTRLDGSRSRDTGGSGLGLAIVARTAELHGGRAYAAGADGLGGASLCITWPRRADR